MVLPARVVEQTPVSQGMLYDGRQFRLNRTKHSAALPGLGDESFTIDITGSNGLPDQVIGFASEQEAKQWLTSTDEDEYTTYDVAGNQTKEKRKGMGLADGMIRSVGTQNVSTNQPSRDEAVARDLQFRLNQATAQAINPGQTPTDISGPSGIDSTPNPPAQQFQTAADFNRTNAAFAGTTTTTPAPTGPSGPTGAGSVDALQNPSPVTYNSAINEGTPVPEAEQENPTSEFGRGGTAGPAENF